MLQPSATPKSSANQAPAFKLHPGFAAAQLPSPGITVQHQNGGAQPAGVQTGQMFAASFIARAPHPDNAVHHINLDTTTLQDSNPAMDGQPLADLMAVSQNGGSRGGSLQSDVSSASAMYRRSRISGQPLTAPGSQGNPGSLDSMQSVRIAEHLSAVRSNKAALGDTTAIPMEGIMGAGPSFYNPEMLTSGGYQDVEGRDGSGRQRVLNDTGRGLGGEVPAASGKTIVADPSRAGGTCMRPTAAQVVRILFSWSISST